MLCDITDESQILNVRNSLLSKFGHIDILINNAAIDPKVKQRKNYQDWKLSIDQKFEMSVVSLEAMFRSKAFGYEMAKRGKGVILNISSDLGIIAPDQRIYKKDGLSEDRANLSPIPLLNTG